MGCGASASASPALKCSAVVPVADVPDKQRLHHKSKWAAGSPLAWVRQCRKAGIDAKKPTKVLEAFNHDLPTVIHNEDVIEHGACSQPQDDVCYGRTGTYADFHRLPSVGTWLKRPQSIAILSSPHTAILSSPPIETSCTASRHATAKDTKVRCPREQQSRSPQDDLVSSPRGLAWTINLDKAVGDLENDAVQSIEAAKPCRLGSKANNPFRGMPNSAWADVHIRFPPLPRPVVDTQASTTADPASINDVLLDVAGCARRRLENLNDVQLVIASVNKEQLAKIILLATSARDARC